jgi:hypothetical protein
LKKIKCPCCGYYTIDSEDEVIVDICEVCIWQYDIVAQENPDMIIGPNKISLSDAIVNYKKFGVSDIRFRDKHVAREPLPEEICEND